jgi:hypothetical protein
MCATTEILQYVVLMPKTMPLKFGATREKLASKRANACMQPQACETLAVGTRRGTSATTSASQRRMRGHTAVTTQRECDAV